MWQDHTSLVELVNFERDCDAIIWSFQENGQFSVQSMYKTISFRGIQPIYTPTVWRLNVPPRIHIFLWLLANNKTLTRSNLSKRQHLDGLSCLFCGETETVHHLFFGCCVATSMLLCGATYLKFFIQTWVSILNQWLGGGLVTKRMPFLIPVVPHLENA